MLRVNTWEVKKTNSYIYSPFETLKKFGGVVYALDLPKDYKIYNICHVSLLKRYVSQSCTSMFS